MIFKLSPMKKKDIPAAIDILEGILGRAKSPLAQDFQRFRLKLNWAKLVGPTIAAKASPVAYQHKILFVWCVSSGWMNQLHYAKAEILKKINEHMGAGWAKDLRFTLDHKAVTSALELKAAQQVPPAPASPDEDEDPPRDH